jgi:hypothetical protein
MPPASMNSMSRGVEEPTGLATPGPKALSLAAQRGTCAHPYLITVEHA